MGVIKENCLCFATDKATSQFISQKQNKTKQNKKRKKKKNSGIMNNKRNLIRMSHLCFSSLIALLGLRDDFVIAVI